VHMIVHGGGLSPGGERFIPCRRRFFLPVRVLSRLFRRLMLEKLWAAYDPGRLTLQGSLARLATGNAFAALLKPLRRKNWFVYAKRPFAGPKAVLAYLSRYTHRVAISNTRLIAYDGCGVSFHYKDYRAKQPRYSVPSREKACLCGLPCQDFQAIPASIPPATMKNSRHLHSAMAALPAKSS